MAGSEQANQERQASHPAYIAGRASAKHASDGNKAAWLDLYADDAVLQDPVGVSPLDPTGKGHVGKVAIEAFWDNIIAPGELEFTIHQSICSGDYWCANNASLTNTMPGDIKISTDLMITYEVNDAGKIVALKAFWDYKLLEEKLAKVMA